MEETMEKRVWQRVRGTGDLAGELRECLVRQGELLGMYRNLSLRAARTADSTSTAGISPTWSWASCTGTAG